MSQNGSPDYESGGRRLESFQAHKYAIAAKIHRYFPDHSGLMPANLITLPHFSVSSAMSFPKSAGEPPSTVPSRSAIRALILGSARPALISLLSLSTISGGVFLGTPSPYTKLASKPGKKSPTVGRS